MSNTSKVHTKQRLKSARTLIRSIAESEMPASVEGMAAAYTAIREQANMWLNPKTKRDFYYMYLTDLDEPAGVLAVQNIDATWAWVGYALCSPYDTYNGRIGRTIASNRLQTCPVRVPREMLRGFQARIDGDATADIQTHWEVLVAEARDKLTKQQELTTAC